VADEVGLALGANSHFADGEPPPEFQKPRLGHESPRGGLAQEVEGQAGGDRERDRPDAGQRRDVQRQIGKRHHGRTRERAAGPEVALVKIHANARKERADRLDVMDAAAVMHLRELAIEKGLDLVAGHGTETAHRDSSLRPCITPRRFRQ
jgi:hypothetical protein